MDFEDYAIKVGLKVNRYAYGEYQFHKTQVSYDAFEAGQQSKQAEIDKIKKLLNQWDNWISVSDNHNCVEIVKECADELRGLLK